MQPTRVDVSYALLQSKVAHRFRLCDEKTAVSEGMVALLKEFYGRGPTQAKSYYLDDMVLCIRRWLQPGRGDPARSRPGAAVVVEQRMEFQELVRAGFEDVIEAAVGRKVIGFMSDNQQNPDLMSEVFVLAPTDLLDH